MLKNKELSIGLILIVISFSALPAMAETDHLMPKLKFKHDDTPIGWNPTVRLQQDTPKPSCVAEFYVWNLERPIQRGNYTQWRKDVHRLVAKDILNTSFAKKLSKKQRDLLQQGFDKKVTKDNIDISDHHRIRISACSKNDAQLMAQAFIEATYKYDVPKVKILQVNFRTF